MKAGNAEYTNPNEVASTIPVFPLTGALLLPGGQMPLNIFEPRYLQMIDDAIKNDKLIGMIQPDLKNSSEDGACPKLSNIGCVGRLTAFQESGDGRYLISLAGICRFKLVEELMVNTLYRQCLIEPMACDLEKDNSMSDVDREAVLAAFRNYLDANSMDADWETIRKTDNETLITALCMMSPYDPIEKQALLEAPDLKARADTLIAISEMHLARDDSDNHGRLQ